MKKTLAILAATFLLIGLTRAQTTVSTGTNQPWLGAVGSATQGVLLEYWTNLNGATVKTMLSDTNYPLHPSGVELWADFESPTNRGEFYGERLRAWVVPKASGTYTFWIASDDNSELWLSPDDNPAHKQLIAGVTCWTLYREWTAFSNQRSAAIQLEAGQRYYIEALHYQGRYAANLSVGWQRPGVTNVEVISGAYLTPYNAGLGGEGITREAWTNSVTISDLPNSTVGTVFGQPTALMNQTTALEAPTNAGVNYGQRLHGYIQAPESGTYTFWIAGGQSAQLWVGTNDNPANKQLVATVPGATAARQWDKYPAQCSTAITLQAGKYYYVETLDEEASGTVPVSVAWQLPDGTFEGPVPATRLTPYDSDNDGMPDWYERQEGFNPYDPGDANQDADFDGLSNLAEYQRGTDPNHYDVDIVALGGLNAAGSTRGFLWERWTNLWWGIDLTPLTRNTNFLLHPDERSLCFKAETPAGMGYQYGQRMRGWLLPPVTGDYIFWVASDDQSKLFLSTNDNPAQKKLIASVPFWTGSREWTKYLEQCSGPIHLEAGKAYYIEGLHYQCQNYDNFSIAWQQPGETQPELISAPYVAPYNYGRPGEGITREVWPNLTGSAVADLTNSAAFQQPAALVEEKVVFETPANWGLDYGQRLQGYIHPPTNGTYTFWIAGSDTAQLWLSTNDNPAHKQLVATVPGPTGVRQWNMYPAQRSVLINLEGGKTYYVEVLHKAGSGANHVSVAWQLPDGTFEGPIPATRLTPYDSDFDGMPDWYEIRTGFDPYNPDDANQDADNDGLSNLQEFQLGTDPNNWDTDGDGIPDGVETLLTKTNANGVTTVTSVSGSQGRAVLGRWQADGTDIYALDRRGAVEFTLSTTNADKFLLKLEGTQNQRRSSVSSFDVILSVDGENLGHHVLNAPYGSDGVTAYVTPFLMPGSHIVRVFWDGAASLSSLRISQVSFEGVADADSNNNGIKDWVERMLNTESGLDTNAPSASYVSPVCLEGKDPYLSMMSVTAGGTNLPVGHNAGQRWYANVPLSAASNVTANVSYQNGIMSDHRQIKWLSINALSATNLTIRAGDSLLFGAVSSSVSPARISIANASGIVTNITATAARPVPYQFASAGTYTVTLNNGTSQTTGSMTVKVVGYSFPNNPECMINRTRGWNLTNVSPEINLEVDPRLNPRLITTLTNNGRSLELLVRDNYTCTIVARLGDHGPILGSVQVGSFRLFGALDTYNLVIQQYPDGSRLVETMDILSPAFSDLNEQIKIIVGGVTFDDGTVIRQLKPGNFDTLGQCTVRFLMPAGVQTANCHVDQVFQGTVPVGTY